MERQDNPRSMPQRGREVNVHFCFKLLNDCYVESGDRSPLYTQKDVSLSGARWLSHTMSHKMAVHALVTALLYTELRRFTTAATRRFKHDECINDVHRVVIIGNSKAYGILLYIYVLCISVYYMSTECWLLFRTNNKSHV